MICSVPFFSLRLLVFSLFVVHLVRMGIYFDHCRAKLNGTLHFRGPCEDVMLTLLVFYWFILNFGQSIEHGMWCICRSQRLGGKDKQISVDGILVLGFVQSVCSFTVTVFSQPGRTHAFLEAAANTDFEPRSRAVVIRVFTFQLSWDPQTHNMDPLICAC